MHVAYVALQANHFAQSTSCTSAQSVFLRLSPRNPLPNLSHSRWLWQALFSQSPQEWKLGKSSQKRNEANQRNEERKPRIAKISFTNTTSLKYSRLSWSENLRQPSLILQSNAQGKSALATRFGPEIRPPKHLLVGCI